MQFSRWTTLAYSILVSICASLTYIFGIYSTYLKTKLLFNQEQITLVATLGNAAQFTGLPAGYVYDRYGPRVTILVGGCLAFTGFFLMYVVTGDGWDVGVVTISVLYTIACFSMSWYDTSNVITNVKNFPSHRGLVIGMSKAFNGLGAAVFAQLYLGVFKPNSRAFLQLVPIIAIAVAMGGSVFLNPVENPTPASTGYFVYLYVLTTVLSGYLASTALAQEILGLPQETSLLITYGMVGILALFWVVPIHALAYNPTSMPDLDVEKENQGFLARKSSTTSRSLSEAIKGSELWLLFFAFFCGTGVGLMLINNVAQLSDALAGAEYQDPNTRSVLVTILAVGSTIGRLGLGALSEALKRSVNRTTFLTVVVGMHMGVQMLLAHATHGQLYTYCFLGAVCYGAYWALMPTICTDLFGVKYLGSIYNFLHFGTSLGTLIMSTLVAGKLYDREAARQAFGGSCYGRSCYYHSFLINTAVCFAGFVAAAALQVNSRERYSMLQ